MLARLRIELSQFPRTLSAQVNTQNRARFNGNALRSEQQIQVISVFLLQQAAGKYPHRPSSINSTQDYLRALAAREPSGPDRRPSMPAAMQRPNNPPAAIAAQGWTPPAPRISYAYSPRLDPALRSAPSGRAEALPPFLERARSHRRAWRGRRHLPGQPPAGVAGISDGGEGVRGQSDRYAA
jgi:hypothetical protein